MTSSIYNRQCSGPESETQYPFTKKVLSHVDMDGLFDYD